jgi:hypothetical protein
MVSLPTMALTQQAVLQCVSQASKSPSTMRAIDKLKRAANLKPLRKEVALNDGSTLVLFHKPLTIAQRENAQKNAKGDDATSFALQLLVETARDENGELMFSVADIPELKREVRNEDVQSLIAAILDEEAEPEAEEVQTPEAKSKAA